MLPAFPLSDRFASDLIERLQQAGFHKFRHPEAVEAEDVVPGPHTQIKGVLLFELLITAAKLHQLDNYVSAFGGHLLLEGGEHIRLQPCDQVGVDAASHAAAGHGQVHFFALRQRRCCRRQDQGKNEQQSAESFCEHLASPHSKAQDTAFPASRMPPHHCGTYEMPARGANPPTGQITNRCRGSVYLASHLLSGPGRSTRAR